MHFSTYPTVESPIPPRGSQWAEYKKTNRGSKKVTLKKPPDMAISNIYIKTAKAGLFPSPQANSKEKKFRNSDLIESPISKQIMPPRQVGHKIAKLYESQVKRGMNITYTHSFSSKRVSSNLSPLK